MLTITKEFKPLINYPLERIGKPSQILFFDIETTGFSGLYNTIYLIGCVYQKDSLWYFTQWFADTQKEEPKVLAAFFHFMKDFAILVHFNGDSFDLPFIRKRCDHYQLNYHFNNITSFDIFKKIKPLKKLLSLENLKQKSIEAFLGLARQDKYTGGQLISVYEEYLTSKDKALERLLLLHNEDDLKGMPQILPILTYCDLPAEDYTYISQQITDGSLILTAAGPLLLPVPFCYSAPPFTVYGRERQLQIRVPLWEGECKLFYEDYQNYYYLPGEDYAIHKSLAEFVEKEHRRKATKKTCYTKVVSRFLPQKEPVLLPALKQDYNDKLYYVCYQPELLENPADFSRYMTHIMKFLL